MWMTILAGILLFIVGEIIFNHTILVYIKNYFKDDIKVKKESETDKPFMGMSISAFKGILERFVLFIALYCGFTPILVVFGALKLGTRLDNKNAIGNDYFLIGNFSSILAAVLYTIILMKIMEAL